MNSIKRITKVFENAEEILFDDHSKIILMSDCHRGDGSWADDFSRNQHLFFAALSHYYREGYTYIELGDGEELWENRRIAEIIRIHSDVYWLLSRFIREGRFHSLYGNHDMIKKYQGCIKTGECSRYSRRANEYAESFEQMKFHEGLILRHRRTGAGIFLMHGHQADFLNDTLWRLSRFLVRHLWRHLELLGVNDPTSAAKNFDKKEAIENRLLNWIEKNNQMLIAGHTHRPMFPAVGQSPYFNDGSCVHPRCITGIEINNGNILLVKWCVNTKEDGTLYVGRHILAGPEPLDSYLEPSPKG